MKNTNEGMRSVVITFLITAALCTGGCASRVGMPAPPSGTIASPGGAPGYQHGADRSRFSVGAESVRLSEHDYAKLKGSEGSFAVDQVNGSAYGVPKSNARPQQLAPYGRSPARHDAFVADYFRRSGIPADQIGSVQGRMLLEATGRADERERAVPKVKAYYSVLQRVVEGVPVPDSFAWARVNADGAIVEEAVYWPAIPQAALASARQLRQAWSDHRRRRELARQIHIDSDSPRTTVAIRHSSASSHDAFEAFASIDVYVDVAAPGAERPPQTAAGVTPPQVTLPRVGYVRHFAIDGAELHLPQERFVLGRKFQSRKPQAETSQRTSAE